MELRSYLTGWKEYFRHADTPGTFEDLDKWDRHRLRAIHLKHWKRGTTIFRELHARGLSVDKAAKVAYFGRRWWRNSSMLINLALPISYFDQLGVPRPLERCTGNGRGRKHDGVIITLKPNLRWCSYSFEIPR